MDFTGMTMDEIRAVAEEANLAYMAAEAAERAEAETRREKIGQAIDALMTLRGPDNAAPGTTNIRAIRAYDAADLASGKPRGTTMATNSPIALSRAYEGLEILTSVVLDLALAVGTPSNSVE